MEYHCYDCGMGVRGLTCCDCGSELEDAYVTIDSGKKVQVCKCPNNCGMIKSPLCCGQDMEPKH